MRERRHRSAWSSAAAPLEPGGAAPPGFVPVPLRVNPPRTYLGWAALCVLLFFPTGVVAVVHGLRVAPRWRADDLSGAKSASRAARNWCIVSTLVGGVAAVVALLLSASYLARTA